MSDVKSTSTTKHNVESEDESVNGDEFGSTDEVKVFKDEDEPDCSESYQAELLAEKSSLINESEQASLKFVVVVVDVIAVIVVDTDVNVVVVYDVVVDIIVDMTLKQIQYRHIDRRIIKARQNRTF